jgi:hypothetical protein
MFPITFPRSINPDLCPSVNNSAITLWMVLLHHPTAKAGQSSLLCGPLAGYHLCHPLDRSLVKKNHKIIQLISSSTELNRKCFLGVKGSVPPSWGEAPDPFLTFI